MVPIHASILMLMVIVAAERHLYQQAVETCLLSICCSDVLDEVQIW